MTKYLCHFHVVNSVSITLGLETEFIDEDTLTEACRMLADKLGITFVYFEEVQHPAPSSPGAL